MLDERAMVAVVCTAARARLPLPHADTARLELILDCVELRSSV